MIISDIVEGWTEPLDYQLKIDGAAANITGMTVALVLYDKTGALIAQAGVVSVVNAATGMVRYSPATDEILFAKQPYSARWKVMDAAGKVAFFPTGEPIHWLVRKP